MIKKLFIIILFSEVFFMGYAQEISVMTYNIRFDNLKDIGNSWPDRKEHVINQLKFYEPGILGIQEGLVHQVEQIDRALRDYKYIGVGRDDGQKQGEFSAVYYDTSIYRVLKNSTFWLSETPGEVSVGWDAALERICTYGLFQHKNSQKKFWVFNTHFDHKGETARRKSAALILKKIEALNSAGYPVVLMGDFNLEPDSEGIEMISKKLKDTRKFAIKVKFGPEGTYNGFNYNSPANRRIDYIFVSEDVQVKKYGVLSDPINLRYPSDHFPVYARLKLKVE